MKVVLDQQSLQIISYFEKKTRAQVKDIIESENNTIFVVMPGEASKAIGKGGANIRELSDKFKKTVKVVEFSPDINVFIANLIKPNKVENITREGEVITLHPVDYKNRGFIIGRNATTLRQTEYIVKKYFPDVKELKVA